jgi:UDP-N-acetylmuramoylalanine--D-glutamate ligase
MACMDVCIVGYGVCGQALHKFCKQRGFSAVIYDDKKKAPYISNDLKSVDPFEYVIVSPGISPEHAIYKLAKKRGNLIGEMQFALKFVAGIKIAITGTNGKSSAVTLLAKVLKKKYDSVFVAGNIGLSLISLAAKTDESSIIVVEVSSFGLELLEGQPFLYGAILNIQEDHLERTTLEEYTKLKLSLFDRVQRVCIYNEKQDAVAALSELMGIGQSDYMKARLGFRGLEHRMQEVIVHKSITFINDSKSTNPASTLYALEQVKGVVYIIVGGYDKGLDYSCWQNKFKDRVQIAFVMGSMAKKMKNILSNYCRVEYIKGFSDAFDIVFSKPGQAGTILFSPGCSSFDEYKNYSERGSTFIRSTLNYVKKRDSCRMFHDECGANGDSLYRSH